MNQLWLGRSSFEAICLQSTFQENSRQDMLSQKRLQRNEVYLRHMEVLNMAEIDNNF